MRKKIKQLNENSYENENKNEKENSDMKMSNKEILLISNDNSKDNSIENENDKETDEFSTIEFNYNFINNVKDYSKTIV